MNPGSIKYRQLKAFALVVEAGSFRAAADWLAGILLFIGLGFLVAPVAALFAGLYADEVAEVVERTRYPTDRPGVPQPLMTGLLAALRFTGFVVLVNIAMLPLLVSGAGNHIPEEGSAEACAKGKKLTLSGLWHRRSCRGNPDLSPAGDPVPPGRGPS